MTSPIKKLPVIITKEFIEKQPESLVQTATTILQNTTTDNKGEVVSVVGLLLHNLASAVVPGYSVGVGTLKDYYDQKVNKKRQEELNSLLSNLDSRVTSVEITQGAIEYFENSILFRLEDITRKLLTTPGRGFDEVIAEFVANALKDMDTSPKTKDLVLSTLLSLDSVDLLVLKTMDEHFLTNLKKNGEMSGAGVTRDSICTLLKERSIDEAIIDRSLQRLQSESLIQPMFVTATTIKRSIPNEELYKGMRPEEHDSQGGYVNTPFGRVFINFLKLSPQNGEL